MTGPITNKELKNITRGRPHDNIKYFVETGSYKGETSIMASSQYEHVFSIEIDNKLYEESYNKVKLEGLSNLTLLHGDSVSLLPNIMKIVKEGAIFFIDAHQSGVDSSWNQKERVPILSELAIILDAEVGPSVFIINDLRLWKQGVWDWVHISNQNILKVFTSRGYEFDVFYEDNDKFVLITK